MYKSCNIPAFSSLDPSTARHSQSKSSFWACKAAAAGGRWGGLALAPWLAATPDRNGLPPQGLGQ